MVQHIKPDVAHLGLPCGTCSRARERPISQEMKDKGAPEPKPLRGPNHLQGFDTLAPHDRAKVDCANKVYKTAVLVMQACFQAGTTVVLENPVRSWLWALLAHYVKQTADEQFKAWFFNMREVVFAMCMFGGKRAKMTKLLVSTSDLDPLARECDHSHVHAGWGVSLSHEGWGFATAQEAEYTQKLCDEYIQCFKNTIDASRLQYTVKKFRLDTLAKTAVQSVKHHQLVPEFRQIITVDEIPTNEHSKLLRKVSTTTGEKEGNMKYEIGIYHSYEEHMQSACQLAHPTESTKGVPDDLKRAAHWVLTEGISQVASKRMELFKQCLEKARQLENEERELKRFLHPSVASVVKDKRICLFKWLLEDIGFEDMSVVDILTQGVELTGWEPESAIFATRWAPPTLTNELLDESAVWRRETLRHKVFSEDEKLAADVLWNETLDEVDRGFLQGPYDSEAQVSELLGTYDWSMTPRFVLFQGEELKPRIIDNFKASAVNAAFGSSSYLDLHDTDFLSCFLVFLSQLHCQGRHLDVELSDGNRLLGKPHVSFQKSTSMLGRGVDLSKAYKQVAVAPKSLKHSVLGVRKSDGSWKYFLSRSLPFGAGASVFAFNKLTRAIWCILVRKFGFHASVFYDDFPIVEYDLLCESSTQIITNLLDLLGWRHAVVGKKAVPFSSHMVVLGVQFDLDTLCQGRFVVQNKEGRIKRILAMLEGIDSRGEISSKEISVLQGLLNFAGRFFMGRALKFPIFLLSKLEVASKDAKTVRLFVGNTKALLTTLKPRIVAVQSCELPIVIYTDAAFENGTATWGAVLLDRVSNYRVVHWGVVPKDLVESWKATTGSQVISQAELLVALLVRLHYRDTLLNRPSLWFIDNESARYTLIKGFSPSITMFSLVKEVSFLDASSPCGAWYERVPSLSNIADLPSRGEYDAAARMIDGKVKGDIHIPSDVMSHLKVRSFDDLVTNEKRG